MRGLLVLLVLLGCGASRVPPTLRGYDVLVAGEDSQTVEFARALKSAGYKVRDRVKGGSRPTAALVHFTFRDAGPDQPTWFHVRLADTRSGVIVGTATIALDSTTMTNRTRAEAAVQALSAP